MLFCDSDESYGPPIRSPGPTAALDYPLSRIRLVPNVSTRTTIALLTPDENRSLA